MPKVVGIPIIAYPIWIRHGGSWMECFPYVRRGNQWIEPEVWIRHNGKWIRSSPLVPF